MDASGMTTPALSTPRRCASRRVRQRGARAAARAAGAMPAKRAHRQPGRRGSAAAGGGARVQPWLACARRQAASAAAASGGGACTHQHKQRCAQARGTRRQRRGRPAVRRSWGRTSRRAVRCGTTPRRALAHAHAWPGTRGGASPARGTPRHAPEPPPPAAAAQRAPCGPQGCCRCCWRWRCAARRRASPFRRSPSRPTRPRATSSSATPATCKRSPTSSCTSPRRRVPGRRATDFGV